MVASNRLTMPARRLNSPGGWVNIASGDRGPAPDLTWSHAMPIKFHCEHCGKTISAPDDAGGRKGRCPSCKAVVYVPAADVEEFELAPIDEAEEQRRKRIIEESLRKEHDLLAAQGRREADAEPGDFDDRHGEGGVVLPELHRNSGARSDGAGESHAGPQDLRAMLANYLALMAGQQIEQAEAIVRRLRADQKAARSAIEQFMADPVQDARIAKIPPPVLNGFLRQLQQQLK